MVGGRWSVVGPLDGSWKSWSAFRPYGAGWLASRPTHLHKEYTVNHYPLEELIERWRREELTAEQMIGQMILLLRGHDQRIRELERRLPPDNGAVPALVEPPRRKT